MGKLISMTVYAKDSTSYASASTQLYNEDTILFAENASLSIKKSVPSASGSINSVLTLNYLSNNEGERHTILIGDVLSTLVSGS